jgi:hypothetical protein
MLTGQKPSDTTFDYNLWPIPNGNDTNKEMCLSKIRDGINKTFHRKLASVLILSLIAGCSCRTTETNEGFRKEISSDLRADFLDPPPYARLRAFGWWLNSNVTRSA